MRRLFAFAVVAIVPLGIPVAIGIWMLRRLATKNTVTVVQVPRTPVLNVMKARRA